MHSTLIITLFTVQFHSIHIITILIFIVLQVTVNYLDVGSSSTKIYASVLLHMR